MPALFLSKARVLAESRAAAWASALSAPLVCLCLLRLSVPAESEVCPDTFYHVAMADLGPGVFGAPSFPAMTLSTWRDAFADKEYGFHLLLGALRSAEEWLGLPLGEPFHVEAVAFAAAVPAAFLCAWRMLRAGGAEASGAGVPLWMWPVALVCACPSFSARLAMLRPHLPGVALCLLCAGAFRHAAGPRGLWIPACAGVLAAYLFSQPHFILLPAVAHAACGVAAGRRSALLIPAAAAAGVACGLAAHPQFPNTFAVWATQSVAVPWQVLAGGRGAWLGSEFARPDLRWALANAALPLSLAAGVWLWLAGAWGGGGAPTMRRLLREPAAPPALMALVAACGALLSRRAVEYAWPFSLLLLACAAAGPWRAGARLAWMAALAGASAAGLLPASDGIRSGGWKACHGFAAWARAAGVAPGAVIGNVNWSDFPTLFYALPECRYLLGLDPMFGIACAPEAVERLERFRTGRLRLAPGELRRLIGTRFAFVSAHNPALARDMARGGCTPVYQGGDGWLFDLDAAPEARAGPGAAPRPAAAGPVDMSGGRR